MSEHFQALPTLERARARFKEINGEELVKDVFRQLFLKHGMDRKFGLVILHRHFDLGVGEKLVEYNGTSSPWPTAPTNGVEEPRPSVWSKALDGQFRPTEFRYSCDDRAGMSEEELSFMEEFDKLLQDIRASDVFGLCDYPGDGFRGSCEITVGRANINLKPADVRSSHQRPLNLV